MHFSWVELERMGYVIYTGYPQQRWDYLFQELWQGNEDDHDNHNITDLCNNLDHNNNNNVGEARKPP